MCRWIAYKGPPVPLAVGLIDAKHSLLEQSRHAHEGIEPMNADGFGLGWYSPHCRTPGLFRDVRPAWNDSNLRDLAEHVRSPMFLAHVRAATGPSVQRSNCHPFRYGRWLLQHNGLIPDFYVVRRDLLWAVHPNYFESIVGTTDSELVFFLALSFGLEKDPVGGLSRAVGLVEDTLAKHGVDGAFHFSAAVADGERLFAVRHATHGTPRTLYYTTDLEPLHDVVPGMAEIPPGSVAVVSEPLGQTARWETVPPGSLLAAENGRIEVRPFTPVRA